MRFYVARRPFPLHPSSVHIFFEMQTSRTFALSFFAPTRSERSFRTNFTSCTGTDGEDEEFPLVRRREEDNR